MNKYNLKWLLLVCSIIIAMQACVPKKKMVYLQTNANEKIDSTQVFDYHVEKYKLQVNDILDVQVRSLAKEANEAFGNGSSSSGQAVNATSNSGGDLYYITGYSINDYGYVDLPIIGEVKVLGLTIPEAKDEIEKSVKRYFSKFYLMVKLGGIRYSALGEFNRPGKYVLLQNQATIFEAIANAGDLTTVAQRDQVTLIRQYPDGTRIHKLNLLEQNIIGSPYYFIQPNDVIYVEPMKQKSFGVGVTGAQTITTVISVVSTSLALILAIQSLNK